VSQRTGIVKWQPLASWAGSGPIQLWSKRFSYLDDVSRYVETDERGVQTSFYYDKFDQDTLITRDTGFFGGSSGQIRVRHVYDNVGNLRRVIDPKGLVEDRVYDGLNRMTHVQYPDDLQRDLGYDLTGKVIQTSVQSRSQPSLADVLTSSYDGAGRVTQESYGANARENVSYQYDAISGVAGESQSYPGQLLSIQRGTGLTSLYRYDSLQRLTRRRVVQPGLGYDVTQRYRYDASGSVASMDLPQGRESQVPRTSYQYDAFHRLSGIAFVAGSDSLPVVRNVTYRANDLLSSLGLGGHLTLSRSYEPQRPLLTNLVTKQDTTTIYRQGYAYDDVGNIIGMQRFSGDSAGYDYDKLYQLRGVRYPKGNTDNRAANLSYGYDANGNRVSFGHDFTNKDRPEWLGYQPATGTSTGSNRLQQGWSGREGYTRYGYDFRGNLSSEKSFGDSNSLVSGSNAWKEETRTFNRRNELERLFRTTRQSGADSSVWAYDYDEKGMRVEKRRTALPVTLTGSDTAWNFDRKYAYDGVSAVADSSAGDTAWNYWVMMGLNRVAQVRRDGNKKWQVHYVVTDHLGTANLVTDSVGQVVQRNVLDPWGNLEMSSGTAPVAYLYTGKEWDAESGEYYFAARYYNPERGSFTGRDAAEQYYSPYNYVGNGPLLGVDPTGMIVSVHPESAPLGFENAYSDVVGGLIENMSSDAWHNPSQYSEIKFAEYSSVTINIEYKKDQLNTGLISGANGDVRVQLDPFISAKSTVRLTENGPMETPMQVILSHEFGHVEQAINSPSTFSTHPQSLGRLYQEWDAMDYENKARSELGIPLRVSYNVKGSYFGDISVLRYRLSHVYRYLP